MSVNTAPNMLKLNHWEKLLYDSGVHKGRYERGTELLEKIRACIGDSDETDVDKFLAAIASMEKLLEQEQHINLQHGQASDSCLQAADAERNRYELNKSRFTAQAIAQIMEVTAVNRG
jgi:hypothetical protein